MLSSVRPLLKPIFSLLLAGLLMAAGLPSMRQVPWQVVDLPTESTLLDIAFTGTDPNHGWLVGDKSTLLETRDGGVNWIQHPLADTEEYLDSISFQGSEGWIVGEPKVLLHTEDEGTSWNRIVLNSKLPGEPMGIQALGPQTAEMITNVGAIYLTVDGGKNWKALVDDSTGLLKNASRSPEGSYLAVSSRGSFYLLYEAGTRAWKPYNRDTSRRIQNMGFGPDGTAWKLNQGAELSLSTDVRSGEWTKPFRPGKTLSYGYLGAAYQDRQNLWIVGGGGLLIHSPDAGKTWEEASRLSNIPANFYSVVFPQPNRGFVLGQKGTLLRYTG